jgi:hypothetical protein
MLLANQTSFLMIRNGHALVKILDEVTRIDRRGLCVGRHAGRKTAVCEGGLPACRPTSIASGRSVRRATMAAETEVLLSQQASER